ncbi:phospholipid N-methyltransferase [Sphingomonas vulcanisoli]|uniref:Phospholipid N-methyltransferase n=1 Tax=Sphingomonas vulcanisoli TaxID=1658060 RepID=A0ABX0U0J8_9SPHN|nr:phospholipid N-methyltransferase [Sphingomonas vulcanisoli]
MNAPAGEQALQRGADKRGTAKLTPMAMFFREFLRHPVMVGSIIPSSKKLIRHMLSRCDWANTRLFVEYGPGVGTFAEAILERLGPDGTYLVIDTNREFIDYLRDRIHDPRFVAVHGSAADVVQIIKDNGHTEADYVLSGLPFSTLPPGVGPKIAHETYDALRTGGAFLVYQFSPKCRDFMALAFDTIDHAFEPVNIPPAQLYWAWKE